MSFTHPPRRDKGAMSPAVPVAILVASAIAPVLAYVDLGTGSYVLQLLFGAVFAGLYVAKQQLKRLISWFKRLSR